MPCSLKVTTFPAPQCTHYEFYVPKNKDVHIYFQFGVDHTDDEEDFGTLAGRLEGRVKCGKSRQWRVLPWMTPLPGNRLHKYYAEEDGWQRERLFQPDVELTMWRQFASRHARGIQTVDHTRGYFEAGCDGWAILMMI